MATTVDEFITKYTLDPSGYVTGATIVHKVTTKLADDTHRVADGMKSKFDSVMKGIGDVLTVGFQAAAAAVGAFAAVAGAFIAGGVAAINAAADYDRLVKGLEAVVGNATRARAAMILLQKEALKPGLNLQEAVGGFGKLVNSGMSEKQSLQAIREFANANARAGGTPESFGRIMLALSQIANTPYLQGDELRQFSEAGIPAYKMIRDKFGTSDTEQLKKQGVTSAMVIDALIEHLSKLGRAGDSLGNTLDNLQEGVTLAAVNMGAGMGEVIHWLKEAGTVIATFTQAGIFKEFAQSITQLFNVDFQRNEKGDQLQKMFLDVLQVGVTIAAVLRNVMDMVSWTVEAIKYVFSALGGILGPLLLGSGLGAMPTYVIQEALNEGQAFRDRAERRLKNYKPAAASEDQLSDKSGITAPVSVGERIAEFTRQTAENTKALRDAVRDGVLGGGMIGSKGITQREMARFTSRVLDARGA